MELVTQRDGPDTAFVQESDGPNRNMDSPACRLSLSRSPCTVSRLGYAHHASPVDCTRTEGLGAYRGMYAATEAVRSSPRNQSRL